MHASGLADITVASIQSLISGSRISKFDPSRFKLVLVDEAHHIVASSYMRTLSHFGLSSLQDNSPSLVGVSATLSRSDGMRLGAALDHIVYHKDYIDLIDERWLSAVIFTTVQTHADISNVKCGVSGDYQSTDLSNIINTEEINNITVRSWLQKCSQRKSTLVFCVDTAHVTDLTNTFRRHGIDAHFITGNTPKLERSEKLDFFKAGKIPVLVNCGVFTEGTDIPNIDCILLAKPTRSRNLLIQMIGRGMRLSPKKENCHIIDMVASFENGMVTTPTLFGLDPQMLLDEVDPNDLKKKKEQEKPISSSEEVLEPIEKRRENLEMNNSPVNRKITFTDYYSVYDLISDTSYEQFVRSISQFAWVRVSGDRYILAGSDRSYLCVEKDPDKEGYYKVKENVVLSYPHERKVIYASPRQICVTSDFQSAIRAADTYARKRYPYQLICSATKWRNEPASQGQIDFLKKIRGDEDNLDYESLSKGKAGDMITKFKHGARGEYNRLVEKRKAKEKLELKKKRELEFKEREIVVIGPLIT